jgi:hypothetical protein
MRIRIRCGSACIEADLNDTSTAQAIADALPITGQANRWGDEIYFKTPVVCDLEATARCEMSIGELAYWPPGQAFCIFWGPTPASDNDEPRAASDVNPIGRVVNNPLPLAEVSDGEEICIERV